MQLLIADDEPATRFHLQIVMSRGGFDVLAAASGTEAWEVWQEHHPQIVISDWNMPGMTGEDFCRAVRQAPSQHYTYFILVTGQVHEATAVAELEAGVDDYLQKPFDTAELLLRVKAGARIVALEDKLSAKIAELEAALGRIETLEGLLPTCCYCKKVKGDDGHWGDLEGYVRLKTRANFSHGYCPDCYAEHVLPQLAEDDQADAE